MDYKIFNIRMRSFCMHIYIPRLYSLITMTFVVLHSLTVKHLGAGKGLACNIVIYNQIW